MDSHLFRKGRWVIDLSDNDSHRHLDEIGFNHDTILIMKYFIFFLYIETSIMGENEFSERHDEIRDAIIEVMRQKFGPAARQLSAVTEGIVTKSLLADGCIEIQSHIQNGLALFTKMSSPETFISFLKAL